MGWMAERRRPTASLRSELSVEHCATLWLQRTVPRHRRRSFPEVVGQDKLLELFEALRRPMYRAVLMSCYAAGLRAVGRRVKKLNRPLTLEDSYVYVASADTDLGRHGQAGAAAGFAQAGHVDLFAARHVELGRGSAGLG